MKRAPSLPSLALILLALSFPANAQEKHQIIAADSLQWGAGPPGLPAGVQVAVLAGDPGKRGTFSVRARLPDGYTVPPHWHSKAEYLTVLSGTLNIGSGDALDKAKGTAVKAGGFVSMPARMRHSVWATGETVIQVSSTGPFDITYVDKKDDPRRASAAAR